MKTRYRLLLAATLTAPCLVQAAEPENYIKYRQAMMKAIGGHMAAASQIVRGKVAPEGDLPIHAKSLRDLSSQITRLFPEGSDFGETQAKVEIWENWEKFKQAAMDAKVATGAFDEAVAGGDAAKIGAAFRQVGKTCKGCHKDFREKDE